MLLIGRKKVTGPRLGAPPPLDPLAMRSFLEKEKVLMKHRLHGKISSPGFIEAVHQW